MDPTQSVSLNEEFFHVWRTYEKCIEDIGTSDIEMKTCIESCHMLQKRVIGASLISPNEEIDDINTEILKFGLIPHFLSELYTNRNEGRRTLSLRASDQFGKIFINHCDNWTILKKEHRAIFDRGFGDEKKEKLNPFQARTEEVENFKLQKKIKNRMNKLLKKDSANKHQNDENKWKLFTEEEDERDFWLDQFQISILKTLKTLKQNAFERPMSERWEKEQQIKKNDHKNKYDDHIDIINENDNDLINDFNHKATLYNFKPNNNDNSSSTTKKGKGPQIWSVDEDGKTAHFQNLEAMKYHLDHTIDQKVKLRTDRNQIFRDPNPWTYTPEQAAQLGLLSEIPKDYDQKRKEKIRNEYLNKKHMERYGKPLGYDINNDDGSELNPGKVEYHRKGKVTTFTMDDVPNDPSEQKPEIEDMTEQEYEDWIQQERQWANWKDDHEKGAGNPYYH